MPTYPVYLGEIDVDIDIVDFLDQCNEDEIDEIVNHLKSEYSKKLGMSFSQESGLVYETQKKLFALGEHAHKFTNEEESFLDKMYKRYL